MCVQPRGPDQMLWGTMEQGMLLMAGGEWVVFWDVWGIKAECATLLGETRGPGGLKGTTARHRRQDLPREQV